MTVLDLYRRRSALTTSPRHPKSGQAFVHIFIDSGRIDARNVAI